jgi:hypothetical protein
MSRRELLIIILINAIAPKLRLEFIVENSRNKNQTINCLLKDTNICRLLSQYY